MRTDWHALDRSALGGRASCVTHVGRLVAALLLLAAVWPAAGQAQLSTYQTKYYVLHTDLDPQGVREVTQRITLMAEEYDRRTKSFAGSVNQRLPFYMFSNQADYHAAGGMPGSAGVYMGRALMAITNPENPQRSWHVIQHEGFHQFVHATIGRGIPLWANEGMAEYFGEGIWTGDDFIVGLIPPQRLKRIQTGIKERRFKSLHSMMLTAPEIWNSALTMENYDQAWSMVHFLGHADGGRYERAFMGFLRNVSEQVEWERAWARNFGSDVNAFQQRWEEYWLGLDDTATIDLYAQVAASTLTSFCARALSQKQKFATVEGFFAAAAAGGLKAQEEDWLPPGLLEDALKLAPHVGEWSLKKKSGFRWLVCKTKDGALLEGRFKVKGGKVQSVEVQSVGKRK